MNERLNQQDFIDLLAEKHGMDKKDAEKFVKEFFLLIEEALENDKLVKVKGLGTFKLVDVDTRESVSINTGERFKIQGYTKVSFIPDNSLRDIINKPFAHFETVVLNDNTVLEDTPIVAEEDEREENVEEDIASFDAADLSNEPIIDSVQEKELVEEDVKEVSETIVGTTNEVDKLSNEDISIPITETVSEKKRTLSADEIIAREIQSDPITLPFSSAKERKSFAAEKKEKSPVPYLVTIIIIVLLLCGGAVLFIYNPDLFDLSGKNTELAKEIVEQPTQNQPIIAVHDTIAIKDTSSRATQVVAQEVKVAPIVSVPVVKKEQEPVKSEVKVPFTPDSVGYIITGTKATYTIKEGETLTKVALHFYGTKSLWPYIVKHNLKVIKNPDHVPYGTTIKIPELVKK